MLYACHAVRDPMCSQEWKDTLRPVSKLKSKSGPHVLWVRRNAFGNGHIDGTPIGGGKTMSGQDLIGFLRHGSRA